MLSVAEIVRPERELLLPMADRISELSADSDHQLKCKVESCLAFSVATHGSTDHMNNAQWAIFICAVVKTLTVTGEFLQLVSMIKNHNRLPSVVGAQDRIAAD